MARPPSRHHQHGPSPWWPCRPQAAGAPGSLNCMERGLCQDCGKSFLVLPGQGKCPYCGGRYSVMGTSAPSGVPAPAAPTRESARKQRTERRGQRRKAREDRRQLRGTRRKIRATQQLRDQEEKYLKELEDPRGLWIQTIGSVHLFDLQIQSGSQAYWLHPSLAVTVQETVTGARSWYDEEAQLTRTETLGSIFVHINHPEFSRVVMLSLDDDITAHHFASSAMNAAKQVHQVRERRPIEIARQRDKLALTRARSKKLQEDLAVQTQQASTRQRPHNPRRIVIPLALVTVLAAGAAITYTIIHNADRASLTAASTTTPAQTTTNLQSSAFTVGTAELPSATISVSGTWAGHKPEEAFDCVRTTYWGSGGYAPAWIQVAFDVPVTLTDVSAFVGQSPDGRTKHEVRLDGALAFTWFEYTQDEQWLSRHLAEPISARTIEIRTTSSPSWVGWKEIRLEFAGGGVFPACASGGS